MAHRAENVTNGCVWAFLRHKAPMQWSPCKSLQSTHAVEPLQVLTINAVRMWWHCAQDVVLRLWWHPDAVPAECVMNGDWDLQDLHLSLSLTLSLTFARTLALTLVSMHYLDGSQQSP